jgi:hypothetical protein
MNDETYATGIGLRTRWVKKITNYDDVHALLIIETLLLELV